MPSLLVLGPPRVCDETGAPIQGLTGQDKRLALLAFLAVERPGGVRRDALLPLFWPELDDLHARNALRQALSLLRRELGSEAIQGHGAETLAVLPSSLNCDAWDFESLVSRESPAEALALYRGDFLEGLHVSDCAELTRWIDDRRDRFRTRAAAAARQASTLAWAAARGPDAIALARRAVTIAPFEETGWRLLLQTEAAALGRASAMRTYGVLCQRLEEDLGAAPEPATAALARAIQAGEATSPVPATPESPPEPPAPAELSAIEAPPRSSGVRRRRLRDLAFLASGLATVALIAFSVRDRRPPVNLDPGLVYIDRFRTTGTDSNLAVLQEGLPELLAFLFTGVGGPRAVDPALTARMRSDTAGDERAALSRAAAAGAGGLVRGSVVQVGPRLIVNAQLLDATSSRVEAEGAAEGAADSLLSLVEGVGAQLLAGRSRISAGSLDDVLSRAPGPLRRFLAGLALYRRGQYQDAIVRFREAVAMDSTFALAAVYWANASSWTGDGPIDGEAVRLANRHPERLPEPFQALARSYGSLGTWAERRHAWELAARSMPNEPAAWERLGDQLFHESGFLGDTAALTESAIAFERATALDSARGTPLLHLMDLAARRGDTAAVREWGARFLDADSAGEMRGYAEWRMAVAAQGGGSRFNEERLAAMTPASRRDLIGTAVLDDLDPAVLDPAERALQGWSAQSAEPARRSLAAVQSYLVMLNRGESLRAVAAGDRMATEERRRRDGAEPVLAWYTIVMSALYGGGDRVAASRIIQRLTSISIAQDPPAQKDGPLLQAYASAVLALWYQRLGDRTTARLFAASARLQSNHSASILTNTTVATSIILLQAEEDVANLARLDSLVHAGPLGNVLTEAAASLTLARMLAARGDTAAALDALARRRYYQPLPVFISEFRRQAAQLRPQHVK